MLLRMLPGGIVDGTPSMLDGVVSAVPLCGSEEARGLAPRHLILCHCNVVSDLSSPANIGKSRRDTAEETNLAPDPSPRF